MKARYEELIIWRIDECNLLLKVFMKSCKWEKKKRRFASRSAWEYETGSSRVAAKCANFYNMPHAHQHLPCITCFTGQYPPTSLAKIQFSDISIFLVWGLFNQSFLNFGPIAYLAIFLVGCFFSITL